MATEWTKPTEIKLLSGGNPQIPKGDGEAPVAAYLDALPDWKRAVGHRLDELIMATVPEVTKAVRWNSPFYGVKGMGWFLNLHAFNKHLKITFFAGAQLDPPPPLTFKDEAVRAVNVGEDDLDEPEFADQLAVWVTQAAALPGWDGK